MESIEIIMNSFVKSLKDKNNDALVRILKNLSDSLKRISKNDRERTLEIIFDQNKGLFRSIQIILKLNDPSFRKSLEECYYLLQLLIKLFKEEYEIYVLQTCEICFLCIKTRCWFFARKAAAETLQKLTELYTDCELPLDEIIEYFIVSYKRLYSKREGSVFYIILGAIARYCPKTENMIKHVKNIFLQLLNDLKSQLNPVSDKQPIEIKLYLDCYWNMFTNFIPFEDESKQSLYFEKLYHRLSKLCEINNTKIIRNKAIDVLSVYMKYFSSFILSDYQKWHTLLNNDLSEKNYIQINAVKNFYKIIVIYLLKENNQDIFLYFKNDLILSLCNKDLPPYKLQLIIYGLGEFAAVYQKYLPIEISQVFQMIALRTSHFFSEETEVIKNYEELACNLQALSQILCYIPDVSFHQLNIVIELSILFVKKFPELKESNTQYAISAIKNTFVNVSHLEKNFQCDYFNSFFREGIIWSCSHVLLVDIAIQQNIERFSEQVVCYKNFLSLWQSLFEIDDKNKFSSYLITQIFNEFVTVLISFIDKLNLNVKLQDNNMLSDTFSILKAENETDFRFFINLIDLYVDIFEKVDSIFFENWIEKLLIYFVKYSYKHPLISGFYKLIKAIFTFTNNQNYFSDSNSELLSQYMCNILNLVCGFSGELQLSCIYLIFNTPLFFIKDLIDQMIPVFKVAFTIGLADLSLASCALTTLEKWIINEDIQCSSDFVKSIVYYMEPYLSSEESVNDTFNNIKNNTSKDSDESLEDLQKRILLLYGSLDFKILLDFIHEKSMVTNASWGKKMLFECKLLFPDICLKLYFDKFIPRIIELTKSSDQKTKLSACELLGSLLTVILFEKSVNQCFDKTLYHTILRLASDSNDNVKNLYYPFVIELIHDISYTAVMGNTYSELFIDSLFEGLTEEFNSCVRDSCGLYLKEFVEWSVKKSWDGNINLDTIIRSMFCRIIDWANNPSNKKRLAAAIAFNHLYMFFQEYRQLYWLELFHAFVKCLEDCDDIQIIVALNLIEKFIKVNPNVFDIKSPRIKAPDYPNETFTGALIWLFHYCGSLNKKCRLKCMKLFENLLPLVSEFESFKGEIMKNIHKIALKSLEEEDIELITIKNTKALLKSLDFYIWIFKHKFIPLEIFQESKNSLDNENNFLKYFTKFITIILKQNTKILNTQHLNTLLEAEELLNLKSEVILKIFKFISTLLLENNLNTIIWNDNLYVLIAFCTFSPQKLGISAKNLDVIKELPQQMEILLILILNNLPKENINKCREYFLIEAKNNLMDFKNINDIINNKQNISTLKQFIEGLFILKKCKFFDFEKELYFTLTYSEDIISNIFQALRIEIMDEDSCKILDEEVKIYLNKLIKFLLQDYQLKMIQILVKLIMNDRQLINLNGSTISHGQYFLETFKEPVFQCMLQNSVETMNIINELLSEHVNKVFFLIQELLTFSQRNKTTESETLANEVINRCNDFKRVLNDNEQRKIKFFDINRIAVTLKKNPAEVMKKNGKPTEFYLWILDELFSAKDLEKKSIVLRNFLICLVDEDSTETNPELLIAFRTLRDESTTGWIRKLESDEILKFQATCCFRILLKMLVVTKSLMLYQAAMKFAAGTYKYLLKNNIKEFLNPYISNISVENALKSLELAYKMFMDLNLSEERFDIIKYFLLPSMELSNASVIKKFYEEKCQEMVSYITMKLDDSIENIVDKKKLIVSKIGFYYIFELIFAKFELEFITVKNPILQIEKPLNQILVLQTLDVRFLTTHSDELKEVIRLLHCAALNCCIAVVSLKQEEKFYKTLFFEDRKKNQLIWERIINCEKKYNFNETIVDVRKNRKTLVNIRRNDYENENNLNKNADSYFNRYSVISLSLVEDLINLNDINILTEAEAKTEEERRLHLSFESDELNDHECMAMVSGVFIHIFNNEISSLPDSTCQLAPADLPDCLKLFRNAFNTQQNNVRLYLMKIIGNTKNAFIPCIKAFFTPIVGSIYRYLENNPLNYVIRDVLVILIQSKYKPSDRTEISHAQKLIEVLIEVAPDSEKRIYRYNLEITESLCSLWSNLLTWPQVLERKLNSDPDLIVRSTLALLRAGVRGIFSSKPVCQLIQRSIQNWTGEESIVLLRFEVFGWILRLDIEGSYRNQFSDIITLLKTLKKDNQDRWARCICSLQRGLGSEVQFDSLIPLVEPRHLPENVRPEAFELFLRRLPSLNEDRLRMELIFLDLGGELRERSIVGANYVLRILAKLVPRLPESELQPLLTLASKFVDSGVMAKQRRLGHAALEEAYVHYGGVQYLRSLILGLDDPSEEVREPLLDFWRNRVRLPKKSDERLLALLDLYTSELGSTFAHLLCFLMIELIIKTQGTEQVEQNNDDIPETLNWATVNTYVPLFAPTLASHMRLSGNTLSLSRSTPKRLLDPSQNELSWRPDSRHTLHQDIEIKKQNYRRFRLSDRNNVYVSQKNFIESIKQFLMRDWLFCKDFTVVLVCQLIKHLKGYDRYGAFLNGLRIRFDQILLGDFEESNGFIGVVLEIVLRSKMMSVDPDVIGKICRKLGLDSLGILLLEQEDADWQRQELEEDEFVIQPKRLRLDNTEKHKWLELARLYKLRGEVDVSSSIFKQQHMFSQDMKNGALAQAENNWFIAKDYYDMAYEVAFDSEKEHCLEGMFECLSQLSSWSEINRKIENMLDGNYSSIWDISRGKMLLPWIFQAQLHTALENFTDNKELENGEFIANFDTWIQNRESAMKNVFGEEMAVFFLCANKSTEMSNHCLKNCLNQLKEQWIHLNSLSEKIRAQILMKLRGLHNINVYLETIKSPDIEEATEKLIHYWNQRMPSVGDDLLSWNIHIAYRLTFAHLLHEKMHDVAEDSSVMNNLLAACVRQRLKMGDIALKYKNHVVAKKHTMRSEKILHQLGDNFLNLQNDFMLVASKYKFYVGNCMSEVKQKYENYMNSWEIAERVINNEHADTSTKINVQHHLFDVSLTLKTLAEENEEFLNLLVENDFVMKNLNMDEEDICEALKNYSFNSLKTVCNSSYNSELADTYTKFGKYCYSLLYEEYNNDPTICEEFISAILTGMSLGSLEAAHYFPCLLKYEYYRNNEKAVELFTSKSENVPSWLFLSWQAQILSYLSKENAEIVIPIVRRLIKDYPNGIMYNFQQTYKALPELQTKPEIRSMYESLFGNKKIEIFFKAMHRVCQPEHYLRYHLLKLMNSNKNFTQSISTLIDKVFPDKNENYVLQGSIYKVLDKYRPQMTELKAMDYETARKCLENITINLYITMKKRLKESAKEPRSLFDYSPYLKNFREEEIELEIPGQYQGNRKPMPKYHTKILKFDHFIRVMESKCNPIMIRMIGNNAQVFDFLVKFGEDLRLDQRLQQIFNITNKTLDADNNCKQRYLSINTYHVVPLSASLGFIQWVDETKSLAEYIQFSMTDKSIVENVSMKYQGWIERAGKSDKKSNSYKKALIKYSAKEVVQKMKEFISYIKWDCLRKTFITVSSSCECFVSLRHNFITSYATMCIIHWITGVGDRHLGNTLIEVKTGKCFGIDLESAFGTGIDQSIPELVPFRLTAQILGLLKPFNEHALFGITMTHVLRALRNEIGPMLACLDVFIHEPLDWSRYINKQLNEEQQRDIKWLPKKKITIVKKKLNGISPSTIMLEELSNMHNDDDVCFSKYTRIINGTEDHQINKRSQMIDRSLTPEEQVQCLLEQATDLNILGRMWVGWCPFV